MELYLGHAYGGEHASTVDRCEGSTTELRSLIRVTRSEDRGVGRRNFAEAQRRPLSSRQQREVPVRSSEAALGAASKGLFSSFSAATWVRSLRSDMVRTQ